VAEEKSIIQIIQKMVQENEPEEKIVSTLVSMGVDAEQAKRLLLVAQADTFTLLSSEIDKMVQQRVDEKQEQIENDSEKFIANELADKKGEIKEELEKEFLGYETALSEKEKQFQESINDSVSKVAKLNEEVYAMANENKKMIDLVNKDLSETKLKGIKTRLSVRRNLLLLFGIVCFIITVALVATNYMGSFNVDYLTGALIFALIGTGLIYLSANI